MVTATRRFDTVELVLSALLHSKNLFLKGVHLGFELSNLVVIIGVGVGINSVELEDIVVDCLDEVRLGNMRVLQFNRIVIVDTFPEGLSRESTGDVASIGEDNLVLVVTGDLAGSDIFFDTVARLLVVGFLTTPDATIGAGIERNGSISGGVVLHSTRSGLR